MISTDPRLQTVSEQGAAEITGMAVKTLQGRRWRGLPPIYIKAGRLVRYRVSDLLTFLDENTKLPREAVRQ